MNKANLRRWRDELRAGTREQGRFQLKSRSASDRIRYCCLGVWCELLERDGILTSTEYDGDWRFSGGPGSFASSSVDLPRGVQETLALYKGDHGDVVILRVPELDTPDGEPLLVTAISANDNLGLTFEQIADCLTWNYQLDD